MTNLDIVKEEIDSLERKEITYAVASRLADLYIVKDHMQGTVVEPKQSALPSVPESESDNASEFISAVKSSNEEDVWTVIDELMNVLKATNPKLYDGVIRKLQLTL